MATADHLRKKRGLIRAGVTRALAMLPDLLQQPNPDAFQITGHMDFLKDTEARLSRLDEVILASTNEENLDPEVKTADEYNGKIFYAVSQVKFRLQEREKESTVQTQPTGPGPSNLELSSSDEAPWQTKEHRAEPDEGACKDSDPAAEIRRQPFRTPRCGPSRDIAVGFPPGSCVTAAVW
ncbi:hypothetical protein HPB51_007501 [Rhipicephalus microplus]|uniref:Uncharacterized protein n=1 Tax=Rhipicephalus microplus TaxID=6941 RepID=A0A9J6DTA7_RHIMP|nr:hypothetical protein HPB51_007501 [Rhipicephalus microplus]